MRRLPLTTRTNTKVLPILSSNWFGFVLLVLSAVVLGVAGGTTGLSGGFWAPDGAYSRFDGPLSEEQSRITQTFDRSPVKVAAERSECMVGNAEVILKDASQFQGI